MTGQNNRRTLLSERWEVRFHGVELHRYATRDEAYVKRDFLAALDSATGYSVVCVRRFRCAPRRRSR